MKCLRCKREMKYLDDAKIVSRETFFGYYHYKLDMFKCMGCGVVELKDQDMRK